jgi:hypothetical protein
MLLLKVLFLRLLGVRLRMDGDDAVLIDAPRKCERMVRRAVKSVADDAAREHGYSVMWRDYPQDGWRTEVKISDGAQFVRTIRVAWR